MRRDVLALVDAGRVDVVAEYLPELRVVEPVALDTVSMFLSTAPFAPGRA